MYHKDGPFDVYCDMMIDGKWMVIQRRLDGTTDFYRNWKDYKQGFGNVNCEYWLGNDNLHNILSTKDYKLRIDLQDWNNETRYAEYDTFFIGNETTNYVLTIGNCSGNVGDSILSPTREECNLNGMAFSTWDNDNDNELDNCALDSEHAGWWFNGCTETNLNGIYYNGGVVNRDGMYWKAWYSSDYSLKTVTMKIRPKL
ncbi:fibrinogen-like protein 1 [Mytilus californianus]|uniref:fibrinogen-like protein 1 n=1 Tax=Mytilus californianus TaxID=6549 RepID=UPI0022452116|nr:fibrinogen-like protein 1 [Mytilus californianus]